MSCIVSMADAHRPSAGADARRDHYAHKLCASVGFWTVWASAASTTSRGVLVRSAAQSRKLDRNPCGTAAMPSSLNSRLSVASESGFPRGLGEYGDHMGDHDSI